MNALDQQYTVKLQIRLTPEQFEDLKARAAEEEQPVAAMARLLIVHGLNSQQRTPRNKRRGSP